MQWQHFCVDLRHLNFSCLLHFRWKNWCPIRRRKYERACLHRVYVQPRKTGMAVASISIRFYLHRPQRSWSKAIFAEACVKNSVHRGGGVCPIACCPIAYPPPLPRTRFGHPVPPGTVHAGRYGQQAVGTHPTGMHTCLTIILCNFFLKSTTIV